MVSRIVQEYYNYYSLSFLSNDVFHSDKLEVSNLHFSVRHRQLIMSYNNVNKYTATRTVLVNSNETRVRIS